jgi:transcriptional regulator with GAF, ATPase, and Fis domain
MHNSAYIQEHLIDLAVVLSRQEKYNEILRIVNQQAAHLFLADLSTILMLNPKTRHTVKTIIRDGTEIEQKQQHILQRSIFGWVLLHHQSLLSDNILKDDRFSKYDFKGIPVGAVLCVPFISNGNIIGCLILMNKGNKRKFEQEMLKTVEKFAAISAPSLNNIQKIQQFFHPIRDDNKLISTYKEQGLLGCTEAYVNLLKTVDAAARCDVRVLLEGESGTGKELVARAIHNLSSRNKSPFVAIDCAAIPDNLMESELFGHTKGAFTGATRDNKGLFLEANHGTLFLDEITNLPVELQGKLLRVLQQNEIRPLGSHQILNVDVRIISASSVPLSKLVTTNNFREELFYRLHVYPIPIPSLDQRQDDIPLLVDHFLKIFSRQQKKLLESVDASLLNFIMHRRWRGNIRELENFMERLVTLADADAPVLDLSNLPQEFSEEYEQIKQKLTLNDPDVSLPERIHSYEKDQVLMALVENDWNQSRAARSLKISEGTIRQKMKKLNLRKPS